MNTPVSAQKLRQIRLGLAAILFLLALAAGLVEYEFFKDLEADKKSIASQELFSIGQLKANQLAAFLKERRGDSLVLTDLLPVGLTQNWWDATNKDLPLSLQLPLTSAVAYYDYAGAMILDAKGHVRFRTGRSMDLSEATTTFVRQVLQTTPPPFSEIYAADPAAPEQPMLDTFAPIKSADKTKTLGVLVLRGNWPDLFAMIQTWPVESRTAETLLTKQDSSQVVLLNELRHRSETTLKPHVPITIKADSPPWPIIKAAQGQYGPLESVDYRGQAVLAYTLHVQGTPWNMTVKIDTREVLEHLQFLQSIAAAGTLIAATGFWLWGSRWLRRQEQSRIRHEAQQVELRLAAIIDSAMDAIIAVNEDQRIVLFNPTAERLFGCAAQDALGQSIDRFIPHRFHDVHHKHIHSFDQSGKGTRTMGTLGAISGLRTDGQEFPIEASISQTQTDKRTLYTVILRDISERVRMETEAQANRNRLEFLLSNTPTVIYSAKETGDHGVTFISANISRVLGYRPEEFVNESNLWIDNIHPDDRARVVATLPHLFEAGAHTFEYRFRHKNGTYRWTRDDSRLVRDDTGEPVEIVGSWLDITERVRAESALKESEERLRLALIAANQGLYDLNVQTGECTVSQEYALMLGYDPAEFRETNEAWRERLHPDDREEVYRTYEDYVTGRRHDYRAEFRQRTKTGDWKWIESVGRLVAHSADGQPLRMLGTHTDITERKAAEQTLKVSQAAIESSLNGIAMAGMDGKITYANPAFLKLWQLDRPEQVLGHLPLEFVPDAPQIIETMLRDGHWQGEVMGLRHDGSQMDLQLSAHTVTDQNGQPIALMASFLDITERKQVEDRLAEAHAMLSLVMSNIPLYVFWKDRTSTYLGSNALFAQAAGVQDPQDLIGKTDFELAWKDTAELYRADDRLVMETKQPKLNFEEPQTRPDGSGLWLSTSKVPLLDRAGEVFGVLGIYEDITVRKHALEREVARARTLQQLSELGLQLSGTLDEILQHVVRMIGELFAVRVVCLSEIAGSDLSFRAVYVDGQVVSNAGGCPLTVTPCATVETSKDLRLYDRVAERFPDASFLRDHKAYAYCGFPSVDGAGRVVAVTCLLDDKPHEFSEEDQGMLRIIGQRIATELERAQTEQSLQLNEARLREAQRLAQVGSWDLNLETSALTWSDEIFRIFEIDPAQFSASYQAFLDLVHPEDRDLVNEAYTTSVQIRRPYTIIHRLLMPDGRIKYVQESCQTFYDEATGQPIRSTGTTQDLTVLKEAELAMAKSESLFRTLATVAPVGIFRTDATGSCLYVNDRWCAITGLDADSAAGYGWTAALHQDDRARVAEEWAQTVRDHQPFRSEYRVGRSNQTATWVVGQAQAELGRDGHVLGYVGTVTDISERKQVELQLEASLREKETLLREVHHRVKNNLQIISSLLHFQAKKAQKGQEQTVFTEGQDRLRAMILVHELLYRSVDLHRVPLGEYLTTLTDQLRHSFRKAASHAHLQIEADNLSVPAAIALPCGMIVTELVTNAFKYAYPDGSRGPVVVRVATGDGAFSLSVSDEGVGLPAAFDLKQSTSFGLQLVANLSEQLGATLTRPPGAGTTIQLHVPLPTQTVTADHPLDRPLHPFHRPESFL